MKPFKPGALAALLLALALAPTARAVPFTLDFSTLPAGGQIGGNPGDLVGWGYLLHNDDASNWFVPTSLNASTFALGTPDAGYFDFPVLQPGQSLSVNFDAGLVSGLYGVRIAAFALPGQSESGSFVLGGEWWSGDPFAGGALVQAATPVDTAFVLQVAGATAIPAPGTMALLAPGLLLLGLFGKRRSQEGVQRVGGLG